VLLHFLQLVLDILVLRLRLFVFALLVFQILVVTDHGVGPVFE
jgi:hypothetical protein